MSKGIGIIAIVVLLVSAGFVFLFTKQEVSAPSVSEQSPTPKTAAPEAKPVNIQASFAIFTNGTFRVFTAAMYHNRSQDAYIEASNPNIIHIKKAGTTWDSFFSTLPFKLASDCLTTGTKETFCTGSKGELQFYLNGVKTNGALSQEIQNGDKLLVTFGNPSEAQIAQQLKKIP